MKQQDLSSPGMMVAFISATFGIMNFSAACLDLRPDSLFAIGIIRLFLGSILFCSALINLLKGNVMGNLHLIFAVCFGLFSGSNMLISVYNRTVHILAQPWIYGIVQICAGFYLAALLPAFKKLPIYQWAGYVCSTAGLFFFGFGDFFWNSQISWFGGWCFLAYTGTSVYTGLSAVIPVLPQGPSLFSLFHDSKS